jgi:hypothetical protein
MFYKRRLACDPNFVKQQILFFHHDRAKIDCRLPFVFNGNERIGIGQCREP